MAINCVALVPHSPIHKPHFSFQMQHFLDRQWAWMHERHCLLGANLGTTCNCLSAFPYSSTPSSMPQCVDGTFHEAQYNSLLLPCVDVAILCSPAPTFESTVPSADVTIMCSHAPFNWWPVWMEMLCEASNFLSVHYNPFPTVLSLSSVHLLVFLCCWWKWHAHYWLRLDYTTLHQYYVSHCHLHPPTSRHLCQPYHSCHCKMCIEVPISH